MILSASPCLIDTVVPLWNVMLMPLKGDILCEAGGSLGTIRTNDDGFSFEGSRMQDLAPLTEYPFLDTHLLIALELVCICLQTVRRVSVGFFLSSSVNLSQVCS